jgi:sulfatase modifying factor 1
MSAEFDPYQKWLGIPPKQQPPNHYRLLGIELFERDPDTISHAADRQMGHVRSFQTGKNSAVSQQLLNEISTARICLLDAQKKAAYDAELRAKLKTPDAPRPLLMAKPMETPSASGFAAGAASTSPMNLAGPSRPVTSAQRPKTSGLPQPAMIAVGVGGLLVVALLLAIFFFNGSRNAPGPVAEQNNAPQPEAPSTIVPQTPLEPKAPAPVAPQPVAPAITANVPQPTADIVTPISSQPETSETPVVSGTPLVSSEPVDLQRDTAQPAPPDRLAVPDIKARQQIMAQIRDVFKDDYAAAKDDNGKALLAGKLMKLGEDSKDNPAEKFTLLEESRQIAMSVCNSQVALKSVDRMSETFDINILAVKMLTIEELSRNARNNSDREQVAQQALKLVAVARDAEDYVAAGKFAAAAQALALRVGEVELRKQAKVASDEIKLLQQQWAAAQAAAETLLQNPDDALANRIRGTYLCLGKRKWNEGLPLLAKSDDARLKDLAQRDLAGASDPAQQAKLGDEWFELNESDERYAGLRVRSAYWYSLSLPMLSGLTKTKVEQRLAAVGGPIRIDPTLANTVEPRHPAPPVAVTPPTQPTSLPPPLAKAPFDAKQARVHQEAWAKHLGTQVETVNTVGVKMVLIPPGEFLMGSTDEQVEAALKFANEAKADSGAISRIENAERPQHKVVITKPFLMSATEVTIRQFKKFSATGYITEAEKAEAAAKAAPPVKAGQPPPTPIPTYLNPGYDVTDDSPAAVITWNDAVAYCKWLSDQEKTTYRLPTEAEWEYACRAGTTTQYSHGDDYDELPKYGWLRKNADSKSHPVGTKLPNGFGLFDMHGNLFEWCGDYFDEKWYSTSPPNDPNGPSAGSYRVIRSGYWNNYASGCRSASRFKLSTRNGNVGFRCVSVW